MSVMHYRPAGTEDDPVGVRVEFGRASCSADDLSQLRAGQVVELDCDRDQDVVLYAGSKPIALGEAVNVGGKLAVRIKQRLTNSAEAQEMMERLRK